MSEEFDFDKAPAALRHGQDLARLHLRPMKHDPVLIHCS